MGAAVFLATFLLAGQATPPLSLDDKTQKLADDVKQNLTLFDSLKSKVANEKDAAKLMGQLADKMSSIAATAVKYQAQAKTDDQRIRLSMVRFEALASTETDSSKIEALAAEVGTTYRESPFLAPYIENLVFAQYLTNEHYPPFDKIVKQSKNNEVIASANLANYLMDTLDDNADINKFNNLAIVLPNTHAGQRAARIYEFRTKLALGSPMPPLDLEFSSGTKVKVSSLLGKVVVLDFWGYWCSASTGEMSEIKDYVTNNPSKLVWIGVNTDSWTKAFLTQRIKEAGIKYNNVFAGSPSGQLPLDLGIINYPSKIIIDSFGIVRYVPSVKDWRRVLDDALSKI